MAIIKRKKAEPEKTEEQLRDEKIIAMAKFYVSRKKSTMAEAGEKYGFKSWTVSQYFSKILPSLDPTLAAKVKAKVERVKAERRAAFVKAYANKPSEK